MIPKYLKWHRGFCTHYYAFYKYSVETILIEGCNKYCSKCSDIEGWYESVLYAGGVIISKEEFYSIKWEL